MFGFLTSGTLWVFWVSGNPLLAWPWFAPVGALTTVITALAVNRFLADNPGPEAQQVAPLEQATSTKAARSREWLKALRPVLPSSEPRPAVG